MLSSNENPARFLTSGTKQEGLTENPFAGDEWAQPLFHPTASELGPQWCPNHNPPHAAKAEKHELQAPEDAFKHF